MLVSDLIKFLETIPQDLLVASRIHSEQSLLEEDEITIVECCEPRPDGWIQDKRKDKPSRKYLMFPGN